MKRTPRRMGGTKRSRRGFLKLVAVGSAAMLAAPAARMAEAASRPKRPTAGGPAGTVEAPLRAAVRAEIEKQKRFTAQALKVVRDYPLTPGSPMAFVFKPLKARRRKGQS